MMNIKYLSYGLFVFALTGCASGSLDQVSQKTHKCTQIGCAVNSFEVSVTNEFNPDEDFSKYHTYAWVENTSLIFDSNHNWTEPKVDPIIEFKFSLDTELRTKGLTEVSSNPDLLVALSIGANADSIALHKLAKEQKTIADDLPEGAALLVISDPATDQVKFISLATGDVDEDISAKETEYRIKYVGQKLLEDFNR